MSKTWKVNDGWQVNLGGKVHVGGDTFSASDDELAQEGARDYVTEVRQQSAPKAENKAQAAPTPRAAKDTGKS